MSNDPLSDAILVIVKAVRALFTGMDDNAVTAYLRGFFAPNTAPPPDTTPPSTVSKPTATLDALNQPKFDWPAATDNIGVDHYLISINGAGDITLGNVLTYTVLAATPGAYSARVKAVDAAGNVSVAYSTTSDSVTVPNPISTPVSDSVLRAAGYLLATDAPYSCDPTGVADSTNGLQQCIEDAKTAGKCVWLKHQVSGAQGVYKISKPIRFYRWETWNSGSGGPNAPDSPCFSIQGAAGSGAIRPVIKLASGSLPAYDNASNLYPMVAVMEYQALNSSATVPGNYDSIDPWNPPTNWKENIGTIFNMSWLNVNLDTNGHAGATCIFWPGCQGCSCTESTFIATGSHSGAMALPATGSPNVNLTFIGGKYGFFSIGAYTGFNSGGSGVCLTRITMTGQTIRCFALDDFMPTVVVGATLAPASSGTVFKTNDTSLSDRSGQTSGVNLCLIDAVITQAAGRVFDNSAAKNLYLRGIYVNGTNDLVQTGGNAAVTGTAGAWNRIDEYCARDKRTSASYAGWPGTTILQLGSHYLLDGVKDGGNLDQVVSSITANSGAPAADWATKHAPDSFPRIDAGTYIDVTASPYNAVPASGATVADQLDNKNIYTHTGLSNSLSAITAAMTAAVVAGHGRVLLPRGAWMVGSPGLVIPSGCHVFGIGNRCTSIMAHESWVPTTGIANLVDTANDASGTGSIGNLDIITPRSRGTQVGGIYTGDRFTGITWELGRKSFTWSIRPGQQFGPGPTVGQNLCYNTRFLNGGGGRHFGLGNDQDGFNTGWRRLLIQNTTEPLAFYGMNIECGNHNGNVPSGIAVAIGIDIQNSSKIRIYSVKREAHSATLVIDGTCSNIAMYGTGVKTGNLQNTGLSTAAYTYIKTGATGILVAGSNSQFNKLTSGSDLYEQQSGISAATIPEGCQLYKRSGTGFLNGTADDTVITFT